MDLQQRSDRELLADVGKLLGSHRKLTAKVVGHLGEIEERRLHLRAGFSSMFEFCVKELRMGEGEAFRRILAARLVRRFPMIFGLLETGALHLSALELLREHLTGENHTELLEEASGKTKRQLEELLAVRFPKPDVPEKIRGPFLAPKRERSAGTTASSSAKAFALEPSAPLSALGPRSRLEPLSSARYRVEITVSAALRDKLELCRDLLSHVNPARDLEPLLERAVDLLLADLERKRLAQTRRPKHPGKPAGVLENQHARTVSAKTRREVLERDGLQCTFFSPAGRRCEARAFLELDHVDPRAMGGSNDASNLRVRCRAHNQLWAEEVYGREYVERARQRRTHFCQRKSMARSSEQPNLRSQTPALSPMLLNKLERVRLALRSMGFSDADARRATAEIRGTLGDDATVEEALRKALLKATRAA